MQGFSWVLIVVTVIVALLAAVSAVYLLVYYQHPEDRNQVCSHTRLHKSALLLLCSVTGFTHDAALQHRPSHLCQGYLLRPLLASSSHT